MTDLARLGQDYDPAVNVDRLEEHPDNPRRGDVDAIDASMVSHGFYGAVVTQRSTGRILAGNHRYRVAVQRGADTVPVIWLDVDDDQARRILLTDNRTGDLAGYDNGLLAGLLDELSRTDLGLDGTGWTDQALVDLLGEPEPVAGDTDPDHVPAPPPPVTQLGDLWLLGPHRLLCGDSTNPRDVAQLMNGERATLMATDPPYLVDYDGSNHPVSEANQGKENRNKEWAAYREHELDDGLHEKFLEAAVEHALRDDAPIYQWHAGTRADLVLDAWASSDVLAHQQIIWVKNRKVLTYADLMQQHEPCFYGWRRGHRPDTTRRAPVEQSTVWHVDQRGNSDSFHPTQKPVALVEWPITWHTCPGEAIYEPFGGSGTALIAAHRLGRLARVIEIAPEFADVICRRWQEHTGEAPILEVTGEAHDFTVDVDG